VQQIHNKIEWVEFAHYSSTLVDRVQLVVAASSSRVAVFWLSRAAYNWRNYAPTVVCTNTTNVARLHAIICNHNFRCNSQYKPVFGHFLSSHVQWLFKSIIIIIIIIIINIIIKNEWMSWQHNSRQTSRFKVDATSNILTAIVLYHKYKIKLLYRLYS